MKLDFNDLMVFGIFIVDQSTLHKFIRPVFINISVIVDFYYDENRVGLWRKRLLLLLIR